ncbi:ribosome biogenesis GTPase YqeH [Pullulanibacillus sp. KACC 23026]|uniref:ribosome biogenesis GTPase YqeH n=1 Tax=Pullulanibacillus sp. KACC 23026 TaxID=3028315 RepID=UPI0023AF5466|nr:ribosome biogenesis GTPase YqeH [Pullulanibacillus sp. KACC 23026]WEG14201.1 ribosome biogenesis GTPase YqeH [Pullulanibacillus sp. KACC 23026]
MSEVITCAGCGIPVQSENELLPGYVPKAALSREVITCQRCFRLTHYNEVPDVPYDNEDFLKLLKTIGEKKALVVYLVDVFDFNGSWVPGIKTYIGKNDCLLVGNKLDILPKSTNLHKLEMWLGKMSKSLGLNPVDISLISAEKGTGIEELAEKIETYRNDKDVYVVGCTNVGKSSFINKLIDLFGGNEALKITTSRFPGTTLNFIDIPLDETNTLYDTPGVMNPHQMAHFIDKEDLKVVMPKKELKPKVYQLNEEQTLFFGGLVRVDYLSGGRRSLVCYVSNELYIHRTKLEQADDLLERQLGDLLVPAYNQEVAKGLVPHSISLGEEGMDLVISGLGWLTVKGDKGAKFVVHAPKGVGVSKRPSII